MNSLMLKILGLVAVAVLFYMKGGSDTENRILATSQAESIAQAEQATKASQALQDFNADLDEKHTKELFDAQEIIDDVLASVSSGKRRLFVKTNQASCSVSGDPKAASLGNAETRTELNSDTSERIIRLTSRGDKAIIQLTACQEYAREISK